MIQLIDKYIENLSTQVTDNANMHLKLKGAIEALTLLKAEVQTMEQANAAPQTEGQSAEVSPKKARRRATKTT